MDIRQFAFLSLVALLLCLQPGSGSSCQLDMDKVGGWPVLTLSKCSSGYDIGAAIGSTFARLIRQRLQNSMSLRRCKDFIAEEAGAKAFKELQELNAATFPDIVDELTGMADGAEVDVEELWILNMRLEILQAAEHAHASKYAGAFKEDACSDVLLNVKSKGQGDKPRVFLAHNEDMTVDTVNHTFFVKLAKGSKDATSWIVFMYAGELASPAFGMLSSGLGFTLNAVFPLEPLTPGLARNFISRAMLNARSLDDLLATILQPGQSCGHSYNLIDSRSNRVMNLEVAPNSLHETYQLDADSTNWFFHANSYKLLGDIKQRHDNSSLHRMAVADKYPAPKNLNDMMVLLGDTSDDKFPIFRTGDSDVYTLCTVVFDVQSRTVFVLRGNPRRHVVSAYISMDGLHISEGDNMPATSASSSAWASTFKRPVDTRSGSKMIRAGPGLLDLQSVSSDSSDE